MQIHVRLVLLPLLALLLAACGSGDDAPVPTPTLAPLPDGVPAEGLISPAAIWDDMQAQDRATNTCYTLGPPDESARRFCVEQLMVIQDAPQPAMDFFNASGRWLLDVMGANGVSLGLALSPERFALPGPALESDGRVIVLEELLYAAFDMPPEAGAWPFEALDEYAALFAEAQRHFRGADDPLELRHFEVIEVVTVSADGRDLVLLAGVHNLCRACGVGVAAIYELRLDPDGGAAQAEVTGLCQGRRVTEVIEGFGEATFHEYSGLQAGRRGVEEPYLLLVPELKGCPAHVRF